VVELEQKIQVQLRLLLEQLILAVEVEVDNLFRQMLRLVQENKVAQV
jgi:hypothetical protein